MATKKTAVTLPVEKKKPRSKKITYPTLRRGSEGDLVVQAQDLMSKAGSSVQVDGKFGAGTQSAVRAFQRKHKLEVTGVIGPETWAELLKIK